ncbi:MAG TPA: hypothetical protein VIG74_07135 [Alphaproteobacteria bacterium]|jgi:hypothetical protein
MSKGKMAGLFAAVAVASMCIGYSAGKHETLAGINTHSHDKAATTQVTQPQP